MISPYFDELSKDFKSVYFLKVDVDAVEVRSSCQMHCLQRGRCSWQRCALTCLTNRRLWQQ